MRYVLSDEVIKYLQDNNEETLRLIEEICKIPAPSGKEEKRAEFVKKYMESFGAKGVYIDEALNVVYPINCEGNNDVVMFAAHTDTVFPDTAYPMPFSRDEKNLYSPGVGDDTACLAIMLIVAKYVTEKGLSPNCGVIFTANSCEEGLGNLKGVKQLMKTYGSRVKEFYTFDGKYNALVNKCVGSCRYEIIFTTEGGHSYGDFGNRNAIYAMSEFVSDIYSCKAPQAKGKKTTYNVGVVNGGTSVNTIAQSASMLYEYRSDDVNYMAKMKKFFDNCIKKAKEANNAELEVKVIGERPCGGKVDKSKLSSMTKNVKAITEKYSGVKCVIESGSTDCNIPMSLGIPSVCVGVYQGSGTHTREEWVEIESIPIGLKIAAELILGFFN